MSYPKEYSQLLSVNAALSRHETTPDGPKRASTKIVIPKQGPFPQIDTVGVAPWARRLSSLMTIRELGLADGQRVGRGLVISGLGKRSRACLKSLTR